MDSDIDLEYDKMKRQLFRMKNAKYPKIPKNISDIENALNDATIRKNFAHTYNSDHELYAGTVQKKEYSFVVFVSRKVINSIEKSIPSSDRNYLIDGTFRIVPRQFKQLLVISVEFRNDVSCFYAYIQYIYILLPYY